MSKKVPEGSFYPSSDLGDLHGVYVFDGGAIHCGQKGFIAKYSDGKMFCCRFCDLKRMLEKNAKYDNLI